MSSKSSLSVAVDGFTVISGIPRPHLFWTRHLSIMLARSAHQALIAKGRQAPSSLRDPGVYDKDVDVPSYSVILDGPWS